MDPDKEANETDAPRDEDGNGWLTALFNRSPVAILIADDRARYIEANPAACDLTGYSREEFMSLSVRDLLTEELQTRWLELWEAFLAAKKETGEIDLVKKSGESLIAEYRAVADITPGVHLSVLHDVTERKRAEQALRDELGQAARLEGILQTVSTLNHEINNPLQALVMTLDLMQAQPELSGEPAQTRLKRMREASDRIAGVVRRIRIAAPLPAVPGPGGDMLQIPDLPD